MERHSILLSRLSNEERKNNAIIVSRVAERLAKKWEKSNAEDLAAEGMIDVETVLLLLKFQAALIAGVTTPDCYVGDKYEARRRSIGRIGPVFEALGLAKPLRGSVLGWTPTKTLRRIISARLRHQKFSSADINKVSEAIIRAILEVARVSRFIVEVLSVFDVKKGREGSWKLTPELRRLLILTSVRRIKG